MQVKVELKVSDFFMSQKASLNPNFYAKSYNLNISKNYKFSSLTRQNEQKYMIHVLECGIGWWLWRRISLWCSRIKWFSVGYCLSNFGRWIMWHLLLAKKVLVSSALQLLFECKLKSEVKPLLMSLPKPVN